MITMTRNIEIGDIFRTDDVEFIVTGIEVRFQTKVYQIQYLKGNSYIKKGEIIEITERDFEENNAHFCYQKEIDEAFSLELEEAHQLIEIGKAEKEFEKARNYYNKQLRKYEEIVIKRNDLTK